MTLYNKSQMHQDAWYRSTDFAITITISINIEGLLLLLLLKKVGNAKQGESN